MFKSLVLFLIIIAFILRSFFIYQGSVSFHYDMARDAFIALQVWSGDLKILGPPTSTPHLYHGVLYYYLLAPLYGISLGDPKIVAIIFAFLNSLVVIPLMLLAKDMFKNFKWVFLSGLLFVISFEATQYAGWISNPSPAMLTMAWFFYFLREWQKGNKWGLYGATLMAVLSTQFQFFLIYLLVLIPIFRIIFKIKTHLFPILVSIGIMILGLSSFLLSALKFNSLSQMLGGLLNISAGTQVDFRPQFDELFLNYINRMAELFSYNFIPTNVFLGGILAFLVILYIKKNRWLLFFLFSNLPIFIFGGHTNTYANVGLVVPAILGVVVLLKDLLIYTKLGFVLFCLIIISANLYTIFKYNPDGQIILVIPNSMNLKNELSVIDQTYKLTEGQPFSINSLTLPLWTNTTWAYLYSWYGKNKYGYVPSFYGHDQIGLLGAASLLRTERPFDKTFFIIEPHVGIPEDRYTLEIGSEDSKTELIEEYLYGELKLQYRKPRISE